MGKLRLEPKVKQMGQETYREIRTLLAEAKKAAGDNKLFYDLDTQENGSQVRRDFLYVAQREGIGLSIRQLRKERALSLEFSDAAPAEKARITADQYREMVLEILREANRPMKKSEIIEGSGLSVSTWNLRINELVNSGKIKRKGNRRDTTYTIA